MPICTLVSGVLQLVRGSGDELGLQPADLAEVRDVFEQRDGPDEPVVRVAHGRGAHAERAPRPVHRPGQHLGGAFRRDGPLGVQHVGHRLRDTLVAGDVFNRFADASRPERQTAARRRR